MGELATREAPEGTHIKPKDENGALAAPRTMHLKPDHVNQVLAAQNTIEYAEEQIEYAALDPGSGSGPSRAVADGQGIPETETPRGESRGFAVPDEDTSEVLRS